VPAAGHDCAGEGGRLPEAFNLLKSAICGQWCSVMTIYATKSTRVDSFNSIPALGVCCYFPLGGFGSLGSDCPQWVDAVGVDSRLDQDCCYSCSFLSS
jgi:hypothetical protein